MTWLTFKPGAMYSISVGIFSIDTKRVGLNTKVSKFQHIEPLLGLRWQTYLFWFSTIKNMSRHHSRPSQC